MSDNNNNNNNNNNNVSEGNNANLDPNTAANTNKTYSRSARPSVSSPSSASKTVRIQEPINIQNSNNNGIGYNSAFSSSNSSISSNSSTLNVNNNNSNSNNISSIASASTTQPIQLAIPNHSNARPIKPALKQNFSSPQLQQLTNNNTNNTNTGTNITTGQHSSSRSISHTQSHNSILEGDEAIDENSELVLTTIKSGEDESDNESFYRVEGDIHSNLTSNQNTLDELSKQELLKQRQLKRELEQNNIICPRLCGATWGINGQLVYFSNFPVLTKYVINNQQEHKVKSSAVWTDSTEHDHHNHQNNPDENNNIDPADNILNQCFPPRSYADLNRLPYFAQHISPLIQSNDQNSAAFVSPLTQFNINNPNTNNTNIDSNNNHSISPNPAVVSPLSFRQEPEGQGSDTYNKHNTDKLNSTVIPQSIDITNDLTSMDLNSLNLNSSPHNNGEDDYGLDYPDEEAGDEDFFNSFYNSWIQPTLESNSTAINAIIPNATGSTKIYTRTLQNGHRSSITNGTTDTNGILNNNITSPQSSPKFSVRPNSPPEPIPPFPNTNNTNKNDQNNRNNSSQSNITTFQSISGVRPRLLVNTTILIADYSSIMPIDERLASRYVLSGPSAQSVCMSNEQICMELGRYDLAETWRLASLITQPELIQSNNSNNNKSVDLLPWSNHPFGGCLATQLIQSYLKLGDIQTVAMLACVMTYNAVKQNTINNSNNERHAASPSVLSASPINVFNFIGPAAALSPHFASVGYHSSSHPQLNLLDGGVGLPLTYNKSDNASGLPKANTITRSVTDARSGNIVLTQSQIMHKAPSTPNLPFAQQQTLNNQTPSKRGKLLLGTSPSDTNNYLDNNPPNLNEPSAFPYSSTKPVNINLNIQPITNIQRPTHLSSSLGHQQNSNLSTNPTANHTNDKSNNNNTNNMNRRIYSDENLLASAGIVATNANTNTTADPNQSARSTSNASLQSLANEGNQSSAVPATDSEDESNSDRNSSAFTSRSNSNNNSSTNIHAQGQSAHTPSNSSVMHHDTDSPLNSNQLMLYSFCIDNGDIYKLLYSEYLYRIGCLEQRAKLLKFLLAPVQLANLLTGYNMSDYLFAFDPVCKLCKQPLSIEKHMLKRANSLPITHTANTSNNNNNNNSVNTLSTSTMTNDTKLQLKSLLTASAALGLLPDKAVNQINNQLNHPTHKHHKDKDVKDIKDIKDTSNATNNPPATNVSPHNFAYDTCHTVVCNECNSYSFHCIICDLSVRGLSRVCLQCNHGGHPQHIRVWFQTNNYCPTGCGCRCSDYIELE